MPKCGTQCWLCDVPVRFDTYKGCSHMCSYCFASRHGKVDLSEIARDESVRVLENFVNKIRNKEEFPKNSELGWIDWEIPIHWGGTSDPFQPIELQKGYSFKCLEYLAESQYPVIISTKGTEVLSSDKYLDVLSRCNAVVQISMQCSEFDRFEPGAPPFEKRLEGLAKISPVVKRTIVRMQPYIPRYRESVLANVPRFKEAGAYGLILEGLKMDSKDFDPAMIRVGSEFMYPYNTLLGDFLKIREVAHANGLKLYAGENRIREYGDSLTCCGVDDLFEVNRYNLNHLLHGDVVKPTDAMMERGGDAFRACYQDTVKGNLCKENSFATMMKYFYKDKKSLILRTFAIGDDNKV